MAEGFLVDANVLIEAANNYYPLDRVPGFWEWMEEAIDGGDVRSITLVYGEIDYPPELVDWVKDLAKGPMFIDVSAPEIQTSFKQIVEWVIEQDFGPEHVVRFLDKADPWIIATALSSERTVVTQEALVGPGSKKIKIPNVCDAYNVGWCNTFEMLERMGARF